MIEDKKTKYCNKPYYMSDTEVVNHNMFFTNI